MTTIDQLTLTAVPLQQYFNSTHLGHATGFLWQLKNRYYLVTNWHVLSAQDFFTRKSLRGDAGRPNMLHALFNVPEMFEKQEFHIPIRNEYNNPLWLIHPSRRLDIAVLPFNVDAAKLIVGLYPLNILANSSLKIEIGMEVFILGYPFKIQPPAFPVWKRGSIASEPEIARLTTDYFLVDTASRPGMSGAPVIRRSSGTHLTADGGVITEPSTRTKFLGVYSGRVPTDHPYEAQIGLVWDGSLIDEIVAGNTTDE
jgi:hypothetical protein